MCIVSDADKSGDKTTHHRNLDRKLTLLVKQLLGQDSRWILPQGPRQDGETMREVFIVYLMLSPTLISYHLHTYRPVLTSMHVV